MAQHLPPQLLCCHIFVTILGLRSGFELEQQHETQGNFVNSSLSLFVLRYSSLAQGSDPNEKSSGDIGSGKRVYPDWTYNVGEVTLDLQQVWALSRVESAQWLVGIGCPGLLYAFHHHLVMILLEIKEGVMNCCYFSVIC